ncbi:MAG: YybH family protein [Lysinibacillus sp.]
MDYIAALEHYIEATNTHRFENVERLLHPDAIYWFSDRTCTTLKDIRAYFENAWQVIKEEKYTAQDVQWLAVDENTATCIYRYCYEGYLNGAFVSGSGRATNVFKKDRKGAWKLIHEHLSSGSI